MDGMSSFTCRQCGVAIIHSPAGYTTGCKHHPLDVLRSGSAIEGDVITHRLPDGRVNVIDCGEPLRAGWRA